MSAPPQSKGEPITSKAQLVEYLEQGNKPRADWRIGTEHEKFAYCLESFRPLPYEGERSIRAVLEALRPLGWEGIEEEGKVIALQAKQCNITLEPGGQLELSGAPVENLHQTCAEVNGHLEQMREVAQPLGVGMLGMGFNPKWAREDIPWMPKGRYAIMRRQMERRGKLGLDMMLRTCTVQVNLDFSDEADMVKKFRVSLALQPVATALFANSPFTEGKPNGFTSYRSHIWTDTDPDRCGILPFVFEEGMGFERYVDYMLDVPMYFVFREGRYIDVAGQSFRDFMKGELPGLPGEIPGMGDWSDHLTTAFPEVRLKRFLEMRGADAGPWKSLCALPALWVGLLYDDQSLDAAWDLVKDWTHEDHQAFRDQTPKLGLKAKVGGRSMQDLALATLEIADAGLARRDKMSHSGLDERQYLRTLWDVARSGITPAEDKLRAYETRWNGSVDPLFKEHAYY
jgi:glutamate--cysteine ligase